MAFELLGIFLQGY